MQFVAVTPCRLLDTRSSNPIPGGTFQTFNLPQLAQANGCAALSAAGTYSLNVTLVPIDHQPVYYLTIWPAGGTQPVVSTMNSLDGRVKANAAIVPAGASGAVSVYVTNTTNVVLDIDGYFAPATRATLAFYPLPPCRVADTRSIDYPQGLGTPHLSAGVARDFPMLSSTCIPTNVTPAAYSLNFTAVPYPQPGDPGLSGTMAHRTAAAESGVDTEQPDRDRCGQCGDCASRHGWRDHCCMPTTIPIC